MVPPPQRIAELLVSERPQERLESCGPGSLSDAELLAIVLRKGTRGIGVVNLSRQLLTQAGSLSMLMSWSLEDFRRISGIGPVKALQIVAVVEIARRILRQKEGVTDPFDNPRRVFRYLYPQTAGIAVEKFWVLCLNRKNRLLRATEVTSGTANSSLVHPREVFREAIRLGASAIIAAHNHPSGDPYPSRADIQVTRQLREASRVLGIDLLDHVIIGDVHADPAAQGFYSFQDSGLL